MYKRLVCAGKRIHELLLNIENEGVPEMIQKYQQQCQLMSSLHHPNVTQFLGLCFLPGTQLPLLVMERLETSLDDLLENMPNLPLSLKRSILENVASGLLYLHERNPPSHSQGPDFEECPPYLLPCGQDYRHGQLTYRKAWSGGQDTVCITRHISLHAT